MVSCIITTYNRAEYIERALRSVINQSYRNIEIIVVDDGSIDDTSKIIARIKDDRIIYVYQNNSGAQAARNKGIKLARGKYIAFLDSDDIWMDNKLDVQLKKLEENKADIIISRFLRHSNGESYCVPQYSYEGCVTEGMLSNSFFATTGTIFGKKECILDTMFDEKVSRFQDFDFIASAFGKYTIFFCDDILLEQYETKVSITNCINIDKVVNTIDYLCDKHKMITGVKKLLYKEKLKFLLKNNAHWDEAWNEYCELDHSMFVKIVRVGMNIVSLRTMYVVFYIIKQIKKYISSRIKSIKIFFSFLH